MIGMPPFDMMNPHRYAPSQTRPRGGCIGQNYSRKPGYNAVQKRAHSTSPAAVPVDKWQTEEEYTIRVGAPIGKELRNPQASLSKDGTVVRVTAQVAPPAVVKYMLRQRALLFAAPRRDDAVGVLPAGTVVVGAPPRAGWIQLADEEGWLLDDGRNVSVLSAPRAPQEFERTFQVPHDGKPEEATCESTADGFVIAIPRCRRTDVARTPPPRTMAKMATDERRPPTAHVAAAAPPKPAAAAATTKPVTTARSAAANSPPRAQQAKRKMPEPAASRPASRAAVHEVLTQDRQHLKRDPVLVERSASLSNVQRPEESCEDWAAISTGGFVLISAGTPQA